MINSSLLTKHYFRVILNCTFLSLFIVLVTRFGRSILLPSSGVQFFLFIFHHLTANFTLEEFRRMDRLKRHINNAKAKKRKNSPKDTNNQDPSENYRKYINKTLVHLPPTSMRPSPEDTYFLHGLC